MMRISVCVGNYAATSYGISGLGLQVYSMEELCYCLRENAYLLDLSLLDERLVDWIDRACGLKDLAKELYPMVRKQGSLSAFVSLIMEYVGLYDAATIRELETVLKESSGLNGMEKRKNQIDYLVRKKKYIAAVKRYDELLLVWQQEAERQTEMPGSRLKADILHNKGVALAGMMEYAAAAECFRNAYETEGREEYYLAYLAAKRMELPEGDYLALVAEQPGSYETSLRLEKRIQSLEEGFRGHEAYRRLEELKERKADGEEQRYYEEVETIGQLLKEQYRESVSE